jgi:predicted transcriptional regulator YdeE
MAAMGASLEVYDEDFNPEVPGHVEIWIPIAST